MVSVTARPRVMVEEGTKDKKGAVVSEVGVVAMAATFGAVVETRLPLRHTRGPLHGGRPLLLLTL